MVDFLIRFEEVEWAVCGGVFEDKLILSVRSTAPDAQAGELLSRVVGRLGRAGGHDRRAGRRQVLGDGGADAFRRPRDHGDLTFQFLRHNRTPLSGHDCR